MENTVQKSVGKKSIEQIVWESIEEFNKLMKRKPQYSSLFRPEIKGIFYNTLRRNIQLYYRGFSYNQFKINDLSCNYRDNKGTLELDSFKISFYRNAFCIPNEEHDILIEIDRVSRKFTHFDNTVIMIRLANIINSLKT